MNDLRHIGLFDVWGREEVVGVIRCSDRIFFEKGVVSTVATGFFKRTNGLSNLFRLLCETATAIGRDIINYIRSVGGERMIQAV